MTTKRGTERVSDTASGSSTEENTVTDTVERSTGKRRLRPGARVASDTISFRHPGTLSGVLITGLKRALRNEPIAKSARVRLAALGYIKTERDRFSGITPAGLNALRAALSPHKES